MAAARGVKGVYLYVPDVRRSVAFYRGALGVSFASHGEDWAEAALADGTRFALHRTWEPLQTPGTVMVDLETADLETTRQRLAAAGAPVGPIEDVPTGRYFEFADPNGYRLQVFQPSR